MTDQTMALQRMLRKRSDATFLRGMIGFAARHVMALEVDGLTGAAPDERSPDRLVQRTGCGERDWQARVGTVGLRIPRLRKGSDVPAFREARRMAEKALTAVLRKAFVHGICTRAADDLVRAMGIDRGSKSEVSRLCGAIDGRVRDFLTLPIEGDWPDLRHHLRLDATSVQPRKAGRILALAATSAVGRQRRRPARGTRHGHQRLRGGELRARPPAQPRPPRPAWRHVDGLRRPAGPSGRP